MKPLREMSVGTFLEEVGSKTPAPGGGAVASITGALAAALGRMVVAYSVGKKSLAEHQPALERAGQLLARTSDMLLELAREDALAYEHMNALMKLPENDERRVREWTSAVEAAVTAPRAVAGACADLLRLLESLAPITNRHLRSDLAIAAVLADAGARSGWWNVRVNLELIPEEARRLAIRNEMRQLLSEADARRARIEGECGE
ncbi:MAG: cyclodeaminase/cyclohydrolase family protein [Phycisphaerales bacterium]|nr:cyclodeaminase/cyclohydrolase family protein [Phycisphaerales bacterium]